MVAELDTRLDVAAALLREARSALFITGAGVSAESGLPTYRGPAGLYTGRHPEEGVPIEVVMSGEYFAAHPEVTWKYLHQVSEARLHAEPNAAHRAIAELQARIPRLVVLTQNVDGLHHAAGSRQIIDIHGDAHVIRCTGCEARRRVSSYEGLGPLPRCGECGAVLRPDVILFGEMLPLKKVLRLEAELAAGFDVVFSVGTTSLFPYIAGPVVEAARGGVPTVEVNPERTEVTPVVSVHLPLPAVPAFEGLMPRL